MNESGMGAVVYSVPEVAKMLGINRNLGYEMARTGQIPTIRLGPLPRATRTSPLLA